MSTTILVGLAGIALSVIFGLQADQYPYTAQRLPMLLVWIVGGLAALMIIEDVVKRRRSPAQADAPPPGAGPDEEGTDPGPFDRPIRWGIVIPFALSVVAYVALMPVVGYVITTVVFICGMLWGSRSMRFSSSLLIALGVTASVWLIFIWALNLPAPLMPWLA